MLHRKIPSKRYKHFLIKFSEWQNKEMDIDFVAIYRSKNLNGMRFSAKSNNIDESFDKLKKIINKKEKQKPRTNIYCYDCGVKLTKNNLFPFTYREYQNEKKFLCKKCVQCDMMINDKEFKKELKWNEKHCDCKAIIKKGKMRWIKNE